MSWIDVEDELPPLATRCIGSPEGWSDWVLGFNRDESPLPFLCSYSRILERWHRVGNRQVIVKFWCEYPDDRGL